MLERKTKELNLFGKKLLLTERDAIDVLMLANYVDAVDANNKNSLQTNIVSAAAILEASMRVNIDANTKWYEFGKKKIKKLLSSQSLLRKLSQQQIFDLATEVLRLEGRDVSDAEEEKKTPKTL